MLSKTFLLLLMAVAAVCTALAQEPDNHPQSFWSFAKNVVGDAFNSKTSFADDDAADDDFIPYVARQVNPSVVVTDVPIPSPDVSVDPSIEPSISITPTASVSSTPAATSSPSRSARPSPTNSPTPSESLQPGVSPPPACVCPSLIMRFGGATTQNNQFSRVVRAQNVLLWRTTLSLSNDGGRVLINVNPGRAMSLRRSRNGRSKWSIRQGSETFTEFKQLGNTGNRRRIQGSVPLDRNGNTFCLTDPPSDGRVEYVAGVWFRYKYKLPGVRRRVKPPIEDLQVQSIPFSLECQA